MPAPTKVQIINGGYQDALGNPLNAGYLRIRLSQDAVIGTQQLSAGVTIVVPLDNTGNVLDAVFLWPTDQMSPTVFYIVAAYTSQGHLVWGPYQETLIHGVSFDITGWLPT